MTTLLVTGANRGIGLGLVKEFLKHGSIGTLIATARDPAKAKDLQAIKDSRLRVVQLDAEKDESILRAVKEVEQIVGEAGLDVLVNNAGVLHPFDVNGPLEREKARANFDVNCVGTLLVCMAFGTLMKRTAKVKGHSQIVNVTSFLATLQEAYGSCPPRYWLAYSMSKAGENSLTRNLYVDWKAENVWVTSVDPGLVRTDMTHDDGDLTVEESTSQLSKTILRLKEEDNGGYFNYAGKPHKW